MGSFWLPEDQRLEFGRARYAPAIMGKVNPRYKTPANSLLVNMGIGIIALLSGKTAEIITLSVFGALSLYILSMITVLKLRKTEPDLPRPFKVPFFPAFSPHCTYYSYIFH
jgi:ethanolamine permease